MQYTGNKEVDYAHQLRKRREAHHPVYDYLPAVGMPRHGFRRRFSAGLRRPDQHTAVRVSGYPLFVHHMERNRAGRQGMHDQLPVLPPQMCMGRTGDEACENYADRATYKSPYDRAVLFSTKSLSKPARMKPMEVALVPFHQPFFFVYFLPQNQQLVNDRLNSWSLVCCIDEEMFMTKMKEWGVELQ